jgi:hypothetical protein
MIPAVVPGLGTKMTKKVLDANFFQDSGLEAYLNADPQNFVVFTDFACMEAYKGNALVNIQKSLEIVARYPAQVVVLKPTHEIIKNQHSTGVTSGVPLEDPTQTRNFRQFCEDVRQAGLGNHEFAAQVQLLGQKASRHFEFMQKNSYKFVLGIQSLSASLQTDHLRAIKKRKPLSSEAVEATIKLILLFSATFMKTNPDISAMPSNFIEFRRSYIFRYSVASYLLAMRWISDGGATYAKPEKLCNDVVDMTYVAYATFFDGLLSKDKKSIEIFEHARFLLDEVFVSEP